MVIASGYDPSGSVGSSATYHSDVEVWAPSLGQHCTGHALPVGRYVHTLARTTVCGGYQESGTDSRTSCLTLTDEGTWEKTTTLLVQR